MAESVEKFRTGLRFESLLLNAERGLQLALESGRLESAHSLSVGERAEIAVRSTLRDYLPAGHGVGHGHVYDAYGDGSKQTDVIITNSDHPLSFPEERAGIYVVDGVAAAGEVKARLTTSKLDDCVKKGRKFKRLRMTISEGDHAITQKHSDYMRQVGLVPPYFVIAFANNISLDTLGEKLQAADLVYPPDGKSEGPEDAGNEPQPPLDAVCILGEGVYLYIRPDNPLGIRIGITPHDGSPKTVVDRAGFAFIPTEAPLAFTLSWLHSAMPRILRGRSVFAPYLIPNQKNLRYMLERGYI